VRRRVVVMQQSFLLSPKFGAKSSHTFTQSPHNPTIVCWIDCLACRDEFFKENYHALDFPCTSRAFFPFACLVMARVSVATFPRFHKIWCTLIGSIVNSHQARYTTPNKRT
jgi:hypothetical protein